ncbi:MAG: hypothetical protein AMXMBFR7_09520 [Planctomycetota bacterium]
MRFGVESSAHRERMLSLLAIVVVTLSAGTGYAATESHPNGFRAAPLPPTLGIDSWNGVTAPSVAPRCGVDVGQSLLITSAKFTINEPFLKRTVDEEPAEDSFSVEGIINLAALVTGQVEEPDFGGQDDSVGPRGAIMDLPRLSQLGQFPVGIGFGFEFFGGVLELNPFCHINPVPATVTPTKIVWKNPKGSLPVVTVTVNPMTGEFSVDCKQVSLSGIINTTDTAGARDIPMIDIVPLFFGIGFEGLEGYGVSIVGAVVTQKNEDAPVIGTYKYAKVGFPLEGEFFVDSLKIDQRTAKFTTSAVLSRRPRELFEHRATLSAFFLPDLFEDDFELCEGICLGIGEVGECIDAEDFTVNADGTIFTYRRPRGNEGVFVSVVINLKTGKLTAVTDWFEDGAFSVNGVFDGATFLEENQIVEVGLETCSGSFVFGALVAPNKKGWFTGIPRILTSTMLENMDQ